VKHGREGERRRRERGRYRKVERRGEGREGKGWERPEDRKTENRQFFYGEGSLLHCLRGE
jgi:hypothetical protein